MISELLPPSAAVAEALDDAGDAPLYPEEEEAVTRAVAKRRAEFVTGRACARRALAQLGVPPVAVPRGRNREPCWPAGVVGSITHCDGYRAAAVARATQLASVGIDAEPHAPLPDGVLETISLPEERAHLVDLARQRPDVRWDRLLFSAKESVYKAWYPLAARWLGFEDAHLSFDPPTASFAARLLVTGPLLGGERLEVLKGRWRATDGHVLTAIGLPAPAAAPADEGAGALGPAAT